MTINELAAVTGMSVKQAREYAKTPPLCHFVTGNRPVRLSKSRTVMAWMKKKFIPHHLRGKRGTKKHAYVKSPTDFELTQAVHEVVKAVNALAALGPQPGHRVLARELPRVIDRLARLAGQS